MGYAEVAKCKWAGTTASAEMSGSVNNYTSDSVNVTYRFWFNVVRTDSGDNWKADLGAPRLPIVVVKRNIGVPAGQSLPVDFGDSYTLPGINPQNAWWNEDDKAKLEVETTVDVDGRMYKARGSDTYYFPDPE